MTVEAAEQKRLLEVCGINPAIFGEHADPAGFITIAIREGERNAVSAKGAVNMVQHIVQHRPIKLGEPLTVGGEVLDIEQVARGVVATYEIWFAGTDGQRALTSARKSLRPDPAKAAMRGTGDKPTPFIRDLSALKSVAQFTLTPELVKAYTGAGNPLHTDPVIAKRSGYRAPIMGGTQGVRFMTAEIWRRFSPRTVALDIQFLRPIFWDDTFSVMVEEVNGTWTAVCLAKDGKVAAEARINGMTT